MKKNLRIVSAAAAALLAVAPVAAAAVATPATVNAEVSSNIAVGSTVSIDRGLIDNAATQAWNATAHRAANATEIAKLVGEKGTVVTYTDPNNNAGKWVSVQFKDDKGNDLGTFNINPAYLNATAATTPSDTPSSSINAGSSSIFDNVPNTSLNLTAVAGSDAAKGAIYGNLVVTLNGKDYTALLHGDSNFTDITNKKTGQKVFNFKTDFPAGEYSGTLNGVTLNVGSENAGKSFKIVLPDEVWGLNHGADSSSNADSHVLTVKADRNGIINLGNLHVSSFWAYNPGDLQEVHFYSVKTGNVVTSGSVNLHAVNGKLTVQAVYHAIAQEYVASQLNKGKNVVDNLLPVNNIKSQLEKAGIKVADDGSFTTPSSFNLNITAKSHNNGAEATLPVTVNVDNAAATNNTNESTKNVTIMHIAAVYTKNGVKTTERLRAYDSQSVVAEPVTLKDANGKEIAGKFYKLAGQDKYIKVTNVDGTQKTLKHASYVYTQYGKKVYKNNGKAVKMPKRGKRGSLRKEANGKTLTVYGGALFNKQYYRIGKNQYIKVANFR